jgi:hypothetical protein
MSDLSNSIILVICKHSEENKDIVKIFKEYFNNIPHIKYTDCNSNKKDTYYLFPYSIVLRNILYHMRILYSDFYDIFGYMTYDLKCSTSLFSTYHRNLNKGFLNSDYFSYHIDINPKTERKILALSEDED